MSFAPPTAKTAARRYCRECGTEGPYDEQLAHLQICFWCAELQRFNPSHQVQHADLHAMLNRPHSGGADVPST